MDAEVAALIEHFQFERIPIEGTFYRRSYTSNVQIDGGGPAGTAIIAMYSADPFSGSAFHKVRFDETWHFYKGDPFKLFLLYPDGTTGEVVMGQDVLSGQHLQFTVPADVWQAGELLPGSRYALFGCTVTPGFTPECFEAGSEVELAARYPACKEIISRLSPTTSETKFPEGYTEKVI